MASKPYQLCSVISSLSLTTLSETFSTFGDGKIGPLKVVKNQKGQETNRTIALVSISVYESLIYAGYDKKTGEIFVAPYQIKEKDLPAEGFTPDIYINLPTDFYLSGNQARQQLLLLLSQINSYGIVPPESFIIQVPLISRETDQPKGYCFVRFQPAVDRKLILVIKLALSGSVWYSITSRIIWEQIRCSWSRERSEP